MDCTYCCKKLKPKETYFLQFNDNKYTLCHTCYLIKLQDLAEILYRCDVYMEVFLMPDEIISYSPREVARILVEHYVQKHGYKYYDIDVVFVIERKLSSNEYKIDLGTANLKINKVE